MTIDKERKKRDTKKKENVDRAIQIYDERRKAIKNISDTDGYKEIVEYWKRETEGCKDLLTTAPKEDITDLQARYGLGKSFLTFLNEINK